MARRIDATMNAMQPTGVDALLDRSPRQSERQQLPPSDDPVLFGGEQSDLLIDLLIECVYATHSIMNPTHAPEGPTTRVTSGSRGASTQRKTCDESATGPASAEAAAPP
jgi:hypothetical protein